MKIYINKKQLMQGVKFTHQVTDLSNDRLKVSFCYLDNVFFLIDFNNDTKVYKFDNYQSFRKQLTSITLNW